MPPIDTYAEYLGFEASSNVKHEFLDGQIYGLAGGTPEHAALKAAVIGLLFTQIRGGGCRLHDADLRVRVVSSPTQLLSISGGFLIDPVAPLLVRASVPYPLIACGLA